MNSIEIDANINSIETGVRINSSANSAFVDGVRTINDNRAKSKKRVRNCKKKETNKC